MVPPFDGQETSPPPGVPTSVIVDPVGAAEVVWTGYTGPCRLSDRQISDIAWKLLGTGPEEVPTQAGSELQPYVFDDAPASSLIMHSATPMLKCLEAELAEVAEGRVADDVATYCETRAVGLARPGDVVVGRTQPWREAAGLSPGVEAVEVPGLGYYYLSHALLHLAATEGTHAAAIARLASTVRARPKILVRLYTLDLETQILLLYLKRTAGIPVLYTDASSPEVGGYWNAKAPWHPTVTEAETLSVSGLSPYEVMQAEAAKAPPAQALDISCLVVPGYTIDGQAADVDTARTQTATAGRLFAERYGITRGCLKPSSCGSGAGIVLGIDLTEPTVLNLLAERMWRAQETFVLEAHVDYLLSPLAPGMPRGRP